MQWHAVYVKSRTEKKVAGRLERKGFEVYCPLQTVLKQWSDRKKKVQEPLFRSYVFLKCNAASPLEVLQTPGVVGLVKWLGKPAMIRQEEIDAIRLFLEEYEDVKLQDSRSFREGDSVKVEAGPMTGSYGQVVREKNHRLVLQIEQLGMVISAEVPKSHVGKVEVRS